MNKLLLLKLSQSNRVTKGIKLFHSAILSFTFCLLPLNICWSDTVHIKGSERAISLKVDKVNEKHIIATIRKNQVNNINIRPESSRMFPDIVYFSNDPKNKVRCKIVDITDDVYAIKLSMGDIDSLEINPNTIDNKSGVSTENDSLDLELLEDMEFNNINPEGRIAGSDALMRESLPDYKTKNNGLKSEGSTGAFDPDILKEQIKKELIDAMNKQKEEEEERFLLENTGKVTGKIFRNGKPYPNCKVQIVALTKERVLFAKVIKRGEHVESVTDENGMYYFKNVSPGNYKLFWKPPYETSWIRRFDMKPDVIVNAGKTTFPKTIEISKRVIN